MAATLSFRSKFSGFHLENITCPRAVFTGSIRELSVGDPAAHLQAARIRVTRGGREARHTMQQRRCAVRAPSHETLYVPMEDKLMGWNVHPR